MKNSPRVMITGDVKGSGEDYEKMGKMWPDEK